MKNKIGNEDILQIVAPSGGVSSGDPILIDELFGFAGADAEAGEEVALHRKGQFEVTRVTSAPWTLGQDIYFDVTNDIFTHDNSGTTKVGICTAANATTDTVGTIVLL